MNNPEKVIDVLTEKIERLEAELSLARWTRDEYEKKLKTIETRPSTEKAEEIR